MEKYAGRFMLLGIGVLCLVMWFVPQIHFLLYPITIFNTYIHELCHAIVAMVTGGKVDQIIISWDGNGLTFTYGGIAPMIASAGYLGSSLVGALTIYFGRTKEAARLILFIFCFIMVAALTLAVRGDVVGYAMGIFWAVLLGVAGRWLKGDWLVFAVRFLGFQLCLSSIEALGDLVMLSRTGMAQTDASNMLALTGISQQFWAYLWGGTALGGMGLGLVHSWKREDKVLTGQRPSPLA